jgi:hypothetical protein
MPASDEELVIYYPYAAQPGSEVHELNEDLLHCQGRFFVRAQLSLPLQAADAPVSVWTWVEIGRSGAGDLVDAFEQDEHQDLELIGTLGADLPGFTGVLGAETRIRKASGQRVVITEVLDHRLPSGEHSEEDLGELFDLIWEQGGSEQDLSHEAIVVRGRELFDRPCHLVEVKTPPEAAIEATTMLLVAPPIDTGGLAEVLTIGSSDFFDDQGRPEPEILGQFINPPQELIDCFGDFSMLTRLQSEMVKPGTILGEHYGVPGSEDMAGWLLWYPVSWPEEDWTIDDGQDSIPILQAIPIYQDEIDLAVDHGAEELIERLAEVEITDLHRASVGGDLVW